MLDDHGPLLRGEAVTKGYGARLGCADVAFDF